MSLILRRSLIFLVLMVAGLVIYSLWFGIKADRYDATAIPYLESAIPELTSWQYYRLKPLLSPGARRDFEDERLRKAYQSYDILGQFKSMDRPRYVVSRIDSSEDTGEIEVVDYEVNLLFDSGPAIIQVKLITDAGRYQIHYFGIRSEVFTGLAGAADN